MLQGLQLTNFRAFSSLQVEGLTRVNLLVGPNNSGKTSVLDAVEILTMGIPQALLRSPLRRGERQWASGRRDALPDEPDVSHLFFGHRLQMGARFSLAQLGGPSQVTCQVTADTATAQTELPIEVEDVPAGPPLALTFTAQPSGNAVTVALAGMGTFLRELRRRWQPDQELAMPVRFIAAGEFDVPTLSRLWETVVLTPEEGRVVQALQIIEPSLERIAFLDRTTVLRGAAGVLVKLGGSDSRLPLGSLGDGLKRLLALAIHMVCSAGGVLLIDEIDTGLHYSVMGSLWRLVVETARRLNIQLFATTHSRDCVNALACLYQQAPELAQDVSLHRIERGEATTVPYSADEVAVAARHHMELRG